MDKDGNFFSGGNSYYFTNLCMSDADISSNAVFPYWDETRPYLLEAETNSKILGSNTKLQFIPGARDSSETTSNGVQYWPNTTAEKDLYWKEPSDIESSPILWVDVMATDSHVVPMIALKRHYGIEAYNYHLICQIKNVKRLYNKILTDLAHLDIVETPTEQSDGTLSILSITDDELYDYGAITIIKENS